jgi:hypothetical protein
MRLFEVTEYVKYGMRYTRDGEPRVPLPHGCSMDIRLHPRVIEVIERELDPPEIPLALKHVSFQLAGNNLMLLKPPLPDSEDDDKALVRVATAGGVGGKVYLTANVMKETEERGRVSKRPSEFPSLGVQPFCTEEALARVRDGVDFLDVIILMEKPGANFCVRRTGGLEGAPPVLSVRWNGTRLWIDDLEKAAHSDTRQARALGTAAFAS